MITSDRKKQAGKNRQPFNAYGGETIKREKRRVAVALWKGNRAVCKVRCFQDAHRLLYEKSLRYRGRR